VQLGNFKHHARKNRFRTSEHRNGFVAHGGTCYLVGRDWGVTQAMENDGWGKYRLQGTSTISNFNTSAAKLFPLTIPPIGSQSNACRARQMLRLDICLNTKTYISPGVPKVFWDVITCSVGFLNTTRKRLDIELLNIGTGL
jgi:hypothetical protein